MSRRLIALLVSALAIAFAFGALTAIRWPSIMMFLGLFLQADPASGLDNINWRQLGFAYGAPCFLAALCFYAASICVAHRRKGGVLWYIMACCAAWPSMFLVELQPGWLSHPNSGEGILAGAVIIIALLGAAVWALRDQPAASEEAEQDESGGVHLTREQFEELMARRDQTPELVEPAAPVIRRRRGPVPAAIARQRAQFAMEGRRMLARQRR
ncbi:hypothetical protein [Henriciella litoralis]|uniref:hypothetical protein n=1 Tax=Henriciella litoralis TaxID=568102 RepID=UPI000A0398FE|nr:hypothetical protein [Henriciella litoralis]